MCGAVVRGGSDGSGGWNGNGGRVVVVGGAVGDWEQGVTTRVAGLAHWASREWLWRSWGIGLVDE